MAVTISKPAINTRAKFKELEQSVLYRQQQFWFDADGVATTFQMPTGWKPLHVFNAGALQQEGAARAYTVTNDGYSYSVVFAVAPANLNEIGIIGVAE